MSNGHSTAFDGIAYKPSEPCSGDTLIIEAGEEDIYIAGFDINELRAYRKRKVHENAYRHPLKYKTIISEKIIEPFVRNDCRK